MSKRPVEIIRHAQSQGEALACPRNAADGPAQALGGKKCGITHLGFEKDTDPHAHDRDDAVIQLAEEARVEVVV